MTRSSSRPDGRTVGRSIGLLTILLSVCPTARLRAQAIDTVVVVSQNVFPAGEADAPGFIARLANALHIRTRPSVIRRLLLVSPGDPYDSARVAESERALRAMNVFSRVRVDSARVDGRLALLVHTTDGWSTKPQLGYSAAGGDVSWLVGLVDENVLGTASTLRAVYNRTPDRSVFSLEYFSQHFVGRRAQLDLGYQNLSDGRKGQWLFGEPFYETAARAALATDGDAASERILVFRDGVLDTTFARRALRIGVAGGWAARATSRGYVRIWYGASWRREDFAAETTSVIPRSLFASAGAGVELSHVRFQVLERFNSYARREDVDLSQTLRLGVWAAPRAWGYPAGRAGAGPEARAQVSALWPRGFAVLRGQANGLYTGAGLDSGRVRVGVTVASQNLPRQTLILHLEGGALERTRPGSEFDLWLDKRGPRVFGAHEFTGTRMAWLALEDRILVTDELWGLVGVGVTPFFDWGGAWYADEGSRLGGDVGIALRLGPTRAVRGDVGEIALGYRFGEGFRPGSRWAVAVRKGVAF
ncbi:MAG: hypothetical protein DMD47_08055 [Gemmatimonadetes bacterium]|nr:MAG: hypothetical protein DMD47_08055 [Gemmatimonadota bacterium]